MKAKIESGKIVLPREVREAAELPENGECDIEARRGELRVMILPKPRLGPAPAPENMLRILRETAPVAPSSVIPDTADEAD